MLPTCGGNIPVTNGKKKKKSVSRDKNEHVDSFSTRVLLSVSTLYGFRWRANFTLVLNLWFRNHRRFYINIFTLIRFILLSDQMSVCKGEGRGKAILNYAMHANWNRGTAPLILKLGTRWWRVVNFTPRIFTHDTQTFRRACRTQWYISLHPYMKFHAVLPNVSMLSFRSGSGTSAYFPQRSV